MWQKKLHILDEEQIKPSCLEIVTKSPVNCNEIVHWDIWDRVQSGRHQRMVAGWVYLTRCTSSTPLETPSQYIRGGLCMRRGWWLYARLDPWRVSLEQACIHYCWGFPGSVQGSRHTPIAGRRILHHHAVWTYLNRLSTSLSTQRCQGRPFPSAEHEKGAHRGSLRQARDRRHPLFRNETKVLIGNDSMIAFWLYLYCGILYVCSYIQHTYHLKIV